ANVTNKVKETTLANYEMKLKKHIIPYFGGEKYDRLTADGVNKFIEKKLAENLSAKYVSDIVLIIKSAAKFAQKRYGYANRIDSVTMPKSRDKSEKKMLTDSEQTRMKKELLKNPNGSNTGILLAASTGLRIGELCALRWQDIDLEKSILTVSGTVQRIMKKGGGTKLIVTSPKSESSKREIPLPAFIIPYLKAVRAADDCFLLSGSKKLVEPRTMQYRFKSVLKKAGLPYVNFHALRHMFATNCIALGFDVKTLSEILGHSNVQITLNRYVHSSMERKKVCMKLFSDRLAA
ncbi:MAG: site-specific integrase, partial [Ruminococcus sp.]|nr:site-specific integrase [Ruminococcus sp.]